MRNQTWLPDGTLLNDELIWTNPAGTWYENMLTGEQRAATPAEAALLPDPDIARAQELLATSPAVITQPEMWELMRIFGTVLGLTAEVINDDT